MYDSCEVFMVKEQSAVLKEDMKLKQGEREHWTAIDEKEDTFALRYKS